MDQELLARIKSAERWKSFLTTLTPGDREALSSFTTKETFVRFAQERHIQDPLGLWGSREDYLLYGHSAIPHQEPTGEEDKESEKQRGSHGHYAAGHSVKTQEQLEREAEKQAQEETEKWEKEPETEEIKNEREKISAEIQQSESLVNQKKTALNAPVRTLNSRGSKKTRREIAEEELRLKNLRARHLALSPDERKKRYYALAKQEHYDKFVSKNPTLARRWLEDSRRKGKPNNPHLANAIQKHLYNQTSKKRMGFNSSVPYQQFPRQRTLPFRHPSIPRIPSPSGLASRGTRAVGRGIARAATRAAERLGLELGAEGLAVIGGPIILIVLVVVALLLLIVIIFLLILPGGATARPADLPQGINYYIIAPPRVENGQDINYQIYFAYDSSASNIPTIDKISIIDEIPLEASFKSATDPHSCDPTCDNTAQTVTWKISDFTPTNIDGSVNSYKFDITLHPEENDIAIVNSICFGIEGQEPICPDSGDLGPSSTPVATPACEDVDAKLDELNVATENINSCPRKQLLYTTVANVFSHSGFEAAMGTRRFVFEGSHGDKCGSGPDAANYRGCTEGPVRMRLRDFDSYGSDPFWIYIVTHELFHVLDFRDSTFSTIYKNTLGKSDTLPDSDTKCYRIDSNNFIIKTYDFDTKAPGESFAESGALYILGSRNGRQTISNFQSECPANYGFWAQKIK